MRVTSRTSPVSEILHTDVVTVGPDDGVEDAMRILIANDLDAAPVVDGDHRVIGVLSNRDLMVQETQLHYPTLISILGASIEIGQKRFEEELQKALGSRVADVMTAEPVTCVESDTVEKVAGLMRDHDFAVIPVVRDGRLVGIVARNDVLRAILSES